MIQDGKLRGFAMGYAIAVRTDYSAGEVRRFAQRAKDAAQARRLLAIAAVLNGASREEAAKIGGMDRQTLRDWVIRFNERARVVSNNGLKWAICSIRSEGRSVGCSGRPLDEQEASSVELGTWCWLHHRLPLFKNATR